MMGTFHHLMRPSNGMEIREHLPVTATLWVAGDLTNVHTWELNMWTKNDFATLAAASVATFGITLAAFWTRAATAEADSPSPITAITTPTLYMDGCEVFAQIAKTDRVTPLTDDVSGASVDPGKMPPVQVIVHNTRNAPTKALFQVTLQLANPPIQSRGRMLIIAPPIFQAPYAIDLEPNETRTLNIDQALAVTVESNMRLTLTSQVPQTPQTPTFSPVPASGPEARPAPPHSSVVALEIRIRPAAQATTEALLMQSLSTRSQIPLWTDVRALAPLNPALPILTPVGNDMRFGGYSVVDDRALAANRQPYSIQPQSPANIFSQTTASAKNNSSTPGNTAVSFLPIALPTPVVKFSGLSSALPMATNPAVTLVIR
jgi:hypothetical protein